MIILKLATASVIGAVIGWITNRIAIRLLFRPVNPVFIPLTSISLQGVLPKRRNEIAASIGEVIQNELVSLDDILNGYIEETGMEEIKNRIFDSIIDILDKKLPLVLYTPFKKPIAKYLRQILDNEGEQAMRDFLQNTARELPEKLNLSRMVQEKINNFEMEHLEKLVLTVAKNELRHIEELGAVLGFLIGILQGVIFIII